MTQFRPVFLFALLLSLGVASTIVAVPPVVPGMRETYDPAFAGQVLLSELNCTACHADDRIPAKGAPDLSDARSRIHPEFLKKFIADPQGTTPGTTMPDVLGNLPKEEREAAAEALADFIRSQSGGNFQLTPIDSEAVVRGRESFHQVGCVACHSAEGKDLPGSPSLRGVSEKYSLQSLAAFLEDPLAARPGGRMPDQRLTHWEAIDLASYLLRDQSLKEVETPDSGRAEEGRVLFERLGCVQCHQPKEAKSDFSRPLSDLDPTKSCPTAGADLSIAQAAQIASALADREASRDSETEIRLTMARLNCVACHERNGFGGPQPERDPYFTTSNLNLGEQARIPPSLTSVGAKLDPKWLRKVLVSGESVRPYLLTRMPKFGAANVESLLDGFQKLDTLPLADFERVKDEKLARESGFALVGTKNLGCVVCHTFNGESASTLASVEMTTMTERLTENWFHLYLLNPQKFHDSTIMPGFWPAGKSVRPEILDGDAGRQIDAIWQYLSRGREARTPEGIRREPIEYGPVEGEAVMLRRQYQGIGKRGIGVGYPSGINLSFDAGQMRLGSIWKGGFGEMSGVWRGQGSGNVGERSRDVVRFPVGPAFALLESTEMAWPLLEQGQKVLGLQFKGYTLDERQRPTFQYNLNDLEITDQWIDHPEGPSFVRTLTFSQPAPSQLYFRAAADPELKAGELPHSYQLPRGLHLELQGDAILRDTGEGKELLIPLSDQSSLVIEYTFRTE